MSWRWFALVQSRPDDAMAAASVCGGDGQEVGVLAAWTSEVAEPPGAAKIDSRAIDPGGEPAEVSLVLAAPGVALPFDDVAVSGALRATLALPTADVVATLLVGDDRFVGALTAVRGDNTGRLAFDPFGTIFPARRLRVGAGLLGRMPAPAGPSIQRYGADSPWPWDRFG